MKTANLMIGLLLCASGFASATSAAACAGGSSASSVSVAATSTTFFVTSFTQKCSANVNLSWDSDTEKAVVCANSKKGKNKFGGSTNGGAPTAAGTCTGGAGTCTAETANLANGGC